MSGGNGDKGITAGKGALSMPRVIPVRPPRAPQENVPPTRADREVLKQAAIEYVATHNVTPPLPFTELQAHADKLVAPMGWQAYRDFAAILINNESWRDVLAGIPYHRRLLLLPVCLRDEGQCPAPFDEFGLLCKECGVCSIHDFKTEAERLGYPMLIAEGTPIVMQLIETGKIDAIVGVSCLNVLERVFPYIEAAAVPGIAIPLLQDDCKDTNIDVEWLWDVIHLTSDDRSFRMDLDALRTEVDGWFGDASLRDLMGGDPEDPTVALGRAALAQAGKRWRPFLTVCTYRAAHEDPENAPLTRALQQLAVAVECFHKASLIHDDIEDADAVRYGEPTLHATHGVPVAINVGDYLIGEGYRLIAECDAPPEVRLRMMHVAAAGHRTLSLGQGAELIWTHDPQPLRARAVLDIFRQKTAPAFEVALRVGAAYAGADETVWSMLGAYSEALGIAYQINDDLDDIFGAEDSHDAEDVRPSLLLALAHDKASGEDRSLVGALWRKQVDYADIRGDLHRIMDDLGIEHRTRELLAAYQEEAVRSLQTLENPTIKGLLRRVLGKIFDQARMETFCRESASRDAAGRPPVAKTTG